MERQRQTKKEIIDWIIAKAAFIFMGDKRDGETPPITVQNFFLESGRHGAKALRARLSRLSFDELLGEACAVRDYLQARPSELARLAEEAKRQETAREHRQRQAEFARKPRLQPAILAAACHYRGRGKNAGQAWDALAKAPFTTSDGSTVEIVGGKNRLAQQMRVKSPNGRKEKRPIGFAQWRKHYWSAAGKLG
jgi:hypothetical protein